jgi:hypothetical protein
MNVIRCTIFRLRITIMSYVCGVHSHGRVTMETDAHYSNMTKGVCALYVQLMILNFDNLTTVKAMQYVCSLSSC